MRWRLKSPASPWFTQPLIQPQIKENIKAPRDWSLWGNSPVTVNSPQKGAVSWKMSPFDDVIMYPQNGLAPVSVPTAHVPWGTWHPSERETAWEPLLWKQIAQKDALICFDDDIWSMHYIDVIMITMASQITSLTVVYSTVNSEPDERKHQSSASLAFVWGIHRDRWIPRTKGQLRGKCFHLMTSSWIFNLNANYHARRPLFFSKIYSTLYEYFRMDWPVYSL